MHRHRKTNFHSAFRAIHRPCMDTSPKLTARSRRWRCGSSTSPLGTVSRASTSKTCSCGRGFAAAAWPARCLRRWRVNASTVGYTRLSWAVLNWNSDAIALYDGIGGRAAERVDHLPAVRPAVGRAGRITLIASGGPAHGRGTEQQDQHASAPRCPRECQTPGWCEPTARYHATGSSSSCGEHRQPAAPALADHQRPSGGEHHAADQHEPDRRAQAVDHPLVGARDPAHHQHHRHHQRGHALRPRR